MAKAVILKTDRGLKIMGSIQCSNGCIFDAEGCFRYCNEHISEHRDRLQAQKLMYASGTLANEPNEKEDWYKDRENFVDIGIPYECDQSYH